MSWYTKGKESWHGKGPQRQTNGVLKLVGTLTKIDEEFLTAGLMSLKGVKEVNLNINTNRLIVGYDSTETGIVTIASKLVQMGYQYLKKT